MSIRQIGQRCIAESVEIKNEEMIDMVADLLIYVSPELSKMFFGNANIMQNGMATYKLSIMYAKGRGVVQDKHEALRLLRLSLEYGYEDPILMELAMQKEELQQMQQEDTKYQIAVAIQLEDLPRATPPPLIIMEREPSEICG